MADDSPVWTIIVAAGSGSRFGAAVPKQFVKVGGRMIVDWSIQAALAASDGIVVVLPPEGGACEPYPDVLIDPRAVTVTGGATRSESVRAGLAAVPDAAGVILVHDAARPVASPDLYLRVIQAVRAGSAGAVPVVPVVDTVRHRDGSAVDRAMLQAVQTPQGFEASILRGAHDADSVATDDASLVRDLGYEIVAVQGERWNIKVTEPDDERVVAVLLGERP